jgi:hypothetical protein
VAVAEQVPHHQYPLKSQGKNPVSKLMMGKRLQVDWHQQQYEQREAMEI